MIMADQEEALDVCPRVASDPVKENVRNEASPFSAQEMTDSKERSRHVKNLSFEIESLLAREEKSKVIQMDCQGN